MANEIVKYENRLNDVVLRRFNSREMNLFFSIAARVRDKGTDEIELSFDQLRDMSKYTQHGEQFVQDLNQTYHKLLSLNAMTDDGNTITAFVLFTKYEIVRSEEAVRISVNPQFKGMFNELSNWTRFSLAQFATLKSTYSKTMFRILKQWRSIGKKHFEIEEFRTLLDVPKSYRPSDLDKRVLKYLKEELVVPFPGLAIKKEHKGRGNKITGYTFTWKPQANDADDFSRGAYNDRAKALQAIKYNNELTHEEKVAATKRVIGRDESIEDLPDHINPTIESEEQKAARLEALGEERAKVARDLTVLKAKGNLNTADQKKLASLQKRYAKLSEAAK
jgi:plasmid replication initiation protein